MNNLLFFLSTSTTGFNILILDIFSILAIGFAIFVIVSKNPIISVLNLIGLFFSIAFSLIIMGLNFIGISYILVYVGAVSILFLFILMLINVRVSELSSYSVNSILLSFIVGFIFIGTVSSIIPSEFIRNIYNGIIHYVNFNDWEINVIAMGNILSLGNIMYTSLGILLLIASIILLLAMVGTIVITIKPKDFYDSINTNKYNSTIIQSKLGYHSFIKNFTSASLIAIIISATIVSLFKYFFI